LGQALFHPCRRRHQRAGIERAALGLTPQILTQRETRAIANADQCAGGAILAIGGWFLDHARDAQTPAPLRNHLRQQGLRCRGPIRHDGAKGKGRGVRHQSLVFPRSSPVLPYRRIAGYE
jgi:hypothetical protein